MSFKWESINKYARQIVENISHESVDVYLFLSNEFQKSDVRYNYLFKFVFRSFYRLDNAGLTDEFKDRYFELLEEARDLENIDFKYLSRELHKYPNRKGSKTLQFSFISKLANTVEPSYPLYDSGVASLYGFSHPHNYKSFDVRLSEYLQFYAILKSDYEKALSKSTLRNALNEFEGAFQRKASKVPIVKKIDFLLWSAGKLKLSKSLSI